MRKSKDTNTLHLCSVGPFLNRGLFAEHFLRKRLPDEPEWHSADGIGDAFRAITNLYREKAASLASSNEAQTEHAFIRPVLDILWSEDRPGDCYQVQVTIPNVDSRRQPDYAFFRSAGDRNEAEPRKQTPEYWQNVPCLGDAKKWAASLDRERGVDENPSAQIAHYLYRSRVRWGILTNRRIWRLYEQERSSPGGVYYEVDLADILEHGQTEAFKYFYLFFRRAALVPGADGKTFLDRVFQGSVDYATEVGDRLKESVYDALRLLMNGFFEHPANALDSRDPETVNLVHSNCLILLYRLLFLLYAEDKGLLPLDSQVYVDHSLKRLHQEIKPRLRAGRTYLPAEHRFWPALLRLFWLIDRGIQHEGRCVIPRYNGGLFSPARYPHIAHTAQPGVTRWEIGDNRVAQVVDMLAYRRERWDEPGAQDIDYKSLDVQHLGSIYEGLLELQPRIAEEAMVEVMEDGKAVFKPAAQGDRFRPIRGQNPRRVAIGEVYLVTYRGERKATGSYYTPKYIVDYIRDNTVGPVTDKAAREVAELRPEVDREIEKLEKSRREWMQHAEVDRDRVEATAHIADLDKAIEEQKRRLLEPYLSLKVLDPAMGSGHFLVGAADFLSMAMATDPNLITPETSDSEEPQAYYKRLVVERCLYGVDINPLAVELAKLSLWLHTVSSDKALSFLDHHLRCGNSLIGVRMEDDLTKEPPKLSDKGKLVRETKAQLILGFYETLTATHLQYFLDTFRRIVEAPTGDAEVEQQKDIWYQEMDAVRQKFRAVANSWLAPYFGVPVTSEQYQQAVEALRNPDRWPTLTGEDWFGEAQRIARDKVFFHWELEFPEAFFHAHGFMPPDERGFDAVMGNPPWEKISASAQEKLYLQYAFKEIKEGEINFYTLFLCRCYHLSCIAGRSGQLVPNTWLINRFDSLLRKFVLTHFAVEQLFYLCKQVFPDAPDSIPVITALVKQPPSSAAHDKVRTLVKVAEDRLLGKGAFLRKPAWEDCGSSAVWFHRVLHQMSVYDTARNQPFFRKLETDSAPLGDIAHASDGIYKTIVERYKLPTRVHSSDRPVVESADQVQRYGIDWTGAFIPAQLWSQHQGLHVGGKIILHAARKPKLERRLIAAYSDVEHFFSNRFILIKLLSNSYSALFLLAVLNSEALNRYFKLRFPITDIDGYMLHQLPIRRIEFITPPEERLALAGEAKAGYERYLSTGDSSRIIGCVQQHLEAMPERADVAHDLLAHLAERMIQMKEEEQTEAKGFLTWLERRIGVQTEVLSNKTRIKKYHVHDFESLLDVLRRNGKKLDVDVNARSVQEEIQREFSASMEKLRPLKQRIAATDRLIDLIVYKLYGLTEEEIRVIEGEECAPAS